MQTAFNSFCLRPIHFVSDVFRNIYPRYPLRRNSAGNRQRIDLMGVSPALLAPTGKYHYPHTFHRLFGKLFRILKRHIYRSSFRSLGVWFLWLPRFHTSRVINVLAELIFYCQDSVGKFIELFVSIFPFTIYWQRNRKTTGIYFSFFIIFSIFTKILLHFSFIVCCDMPYSLASLL